MSMGFYLQYSTAEINLSRLKVVTSLKSDDRLQNYLQRLRF